MNSMDHAFNPGDIDPGFPPIAIPNPVEGQPDFSARTLIALPEGGFIVGCQEDIHRQPPCLVRIGPDNSLDPTFGLNGYAFVALETDPSAANAGYLLEVRQLKNGKLLARLETITTVQNRSVTCLALAQFTADGQKDPTFGANGLRVYPLPGSTQQHPAASPEAPRTARFPYLSYGDLQVMDDGKLLVLTTARDIQDNIHRPYVLRLTEDGEFDPTFNGKGLMEPVTHLWFRPHRLLLQARGKILISGEHPGIPFIARFDDSGTLDTSFGENGYFTDFEPGKYSYSSYLTLLPDSAGNIVTVGQRGGPTFLHGRGVVVICKIDTNGEPLADFNGGKSVLLESREPGDVVLCAFDAFIDRTDRIVLGGRHMSPASGVTGFTARLLKDGQPDSSVGPAGVHYYENISSLLDMTESLETDAGYYATASLRDFAPDRVYRLLG